MLQVYHWSLEWFRELSDVVQGVVECCLMAVFE